MGSDAEVVVVGSPDDHGDLLDDARAHLLRLERRWSRFLPGSDISRINRAAGEAVAVDDSTIQLVEHLVHAYRATSGAFDPTLLPALVALGYEVSWDDPSHRTSLPGGVRAGCDIDQVRVDRRQGVVWLAPGVTLDAGGLGKGLAADMVVERLLDHGALGALVSVGGDLRVGGRPPSGPGWLLAIADPFSGDGAGEVARVHVTAGAIATSSTLRRTWSSGGSPRHHLLDPAGKLPVDTGIAAVSVVAGTAAWAEAWTKAVMVHGVEPGLARLDELGLAGLAVTLDGSVVTSSRWTELVP